MNKIYRIVFNRMTGRWVVASEMAKGRKKASSSRTVLAAVLMTSAVGFAGVAAAGSLDGGVVTGTGVAVGPGAHASSSTAESSTAVGANAKAEANASVAIGSDATVVMGGAVGSYSSTQPGGIAIGTSSIGNGLGVIAIGYNANAQHDNATALGAYSDATQDKAMALGVTSLASATSAVAVGYGASATTQNSVALGANSTTTATLTNAAYNPGSTPLSGTASTANGEVSIGAATKERRLTNLAAGSAATDAVNVSQLQAQDATVDKQGADTAAALGGTSSYNATTGAISAPSYTLTNANAIGSTSGAATDVGSGFAKVDGALGKLNTTVTNITNGGGIKYFHVASSDLDSKALGADSTAIGPNAVSSGSADVAIGNGAQANGGFALGSWANASGGGAVAIGQSATAAGNTALALGGASNASGKFSIAQGFFASASQDSAIAVGNSARASQVKALALGAGANASATNSVALGGGSSTSADLTAAGYNPGSAALSGTASTANGEVSIGAATKERRLTNLAAGSAATDAVNVSQLQAEDATVDLMGANTAAALGGGASYDAATGAISAPVYTVTHADGTTSQVSGVEGAVSNLDGRVYQNTQDIAGNTSAITTINNQLNSGAIGLVQQAGAGQKLTVGKDTDGSDVDFADKNGNTRTLKNVAAGVADTDAVNMSQLNATDANVARVEGKADQAGAATAAALGGGASYDTATGAISAPVYTVTHADGTTSQVSGVEGAVSNLDGRVYQNTQDIAGNTSAITTINQQLNDGTVGLVQYDDTAGLVTVAKDKAGTAVDFRGTVGARRLKGVAAGGEDEDAVNVSQLKKVTDAMGGGAAVNADGSITAPTYYVTNADGSKSSVSNVGDAVTNLDGRLYNNTTAISTINQQISSGTIGLVQQAAPGAKLTVGKDTDGTEVDFADNGGNARKLTNVADGAVAAGSKDAVNGGQLHAVSQSMASALGGGSVVNADGTISAPSYSVTNADGTTSQVNGVEGAISNIDNRVYQNTTAIAGNTSAINNLTTQISNGEVGLVKQDAATRQITVAKDSDGTSVNVAGTAGDRVVTGVAMAKADNDAVNLGQLKAAGVIAANGEAKSVVTYDNADKSSMTMGGEGATTAVTVHNVADGVADHDAVNVSQLNTRLQQNSTEVLVQANSYTDQQIGDVWTGMDKLATQMAKQDSRISQQGAMSMAESQMASGAAAAAVGNPNGAWSVGLGSEQGHGAISAGYAKPIGEKSQISFGAAFSGSDHSIGVGFAHRL
ncbi:ESPR-type extended signal peptide-containing protein [Lysobacter sp. LF1]|uniref:ESPR-type extended signal peptide-containing protein n=1 Tax=Lysobacter stagni TaxID=3045172 RepID=A0ABT6XK51_9GAMM|nr:ESPR-type extended signal peptide-containing protein [Lysobacter sp. LF1]MDI9240552.1 ESPR-type extended signal peptide-containing protein [Lysobacter sp. LF1]